MKAHDQKIIHDDPDFLAHEPVPGYRAVFHVAVVLASLYLVYIFVG